MNPEKFNPSDPKYKKVEDLPPGYQGKFENIPTTEEGDGFVRNEASWAYRDAEGVARKHNKDRSIFLKMIGRGRITPEDILQEKALKIAKDEERRSKIRKDLLNNTLETSFSELNFQEQRIYIADAEEIISDKLCAQKEADMIFRGMEDIKNLGHEGLLFFRDCGSDGCHELYGEIDGSSVEIHMGDRYGGPNGRVGERTIRGEACLDFINAYRSVAINVGRGGYGYGKNYPEWVTKAVKNDIQLANLDEIKALWNIQEKYFVAERANNSRLEEESKLRTERNIEGERNAIADLLPKK